MPKTCTRQGSKKYTTRPSPPYPANVCQGMKMVGNDGRVYVSKPDYRGIHRWTPVSGGGYARKATPKAVPKKRAVPKTKKRVVRKVVRKPKKTVRRSKFALGYPTLSYDPQAAPVGFGFRDFGAPRNMKKNIRERNQSLFQDQARRRKSEHVKRLLNPDRDIKIYELVMSNVSDILTDQYDEDNFHGLITSGREVNDIINHIYHCVADFLNITQQDQQL